MILTALSLALGALGAEPTVESQLLPKTPPDWRFERIDFPLPFAPELKYDGFEELRFAPGMFKAESETYFTYIFAMKITSQITIDAAMLKQFLETYFRGLCRTVSKGSDFDIDVSKISATVSEQHHEALHARRFLVTLDSFDPFVTGKPLKLYLDLLAIKKSRDDHRIFAAVSPKPASSPVWKLLRQLQREFQAGDTHSEK